MKKRIGEIRYRLLRVVQYFNLIMFASTTMTFIKVYDLPYWTALFLIPCMMFLYFLDGKVVKQEIQYINSNNHEWQEMRKELREMKNEF